IHGRVIFNPKPETISAYETHRKSYMAHEKSLLKETTPITKTKDGKRIYIQANIEFEEELNNIQKVGADGIGLFRTEGIFINRQVLPSEEEQFEIYDRIARQVYPKKVVIRTLDVGGDKIMPDLINIQERNPNLGWRAIRFCLDHSECFLAQLKAILRANSRGNVQLLLPMISSLEEVHQVKELLRESKKLLGKEGKEYGGNLELGIMVEVPSVVFIADIFAKEVDFFSIGTNDLVQYNLAVDRGNEKVAYLYSHFHPSVLRMVQFTLDAGRKAGIPVSMCGEMAADPLAIPLLLAMGFEYLSASHFIIPEIKKIIRELTIEECKNLYKNVMKLRTTKEITGTLHEYFKERFYELEII
ncbi:MAG: phosphoenolpyruvate--protein phosphotransferase, partial [Calditrichia bacterium]